MSSSRNITVGKHGPADPIYLGDIHSNIFGIGVYYMPSTGEAGFFAFLSIPESPFSVGAGASASSQKIDLFGFLGAEQPLRGPVFTQPFEEIGLGGISIPRGSEGSITSYIGRIDVPGTGVGVNILGIGGQAVRGVETTTTVHPIDAAKDALDQLRKSIEDATANILSRPYASPSGAVGRHGPLPDPRSDPDLSLP